MKEFFTSDTHINHKNIIPYTRPQFESVEEMNDAIVHLWNAVIQPGDTVYHLGDFAMGQKVLWPEHRALLNGNIHLIRGNHDTYRDKDSDEERDAKLLACGFASVQDELYVTINGVTYWCHHLPTDGSDHSERGYIRPPATRPYDIALCGHVHDMWRVAADGTVNVGIDAWLGEPITPERVRGAVLEWWNLGCKQLPPFKPNASPGAF